MIFPKRKWRASYNRQPMVDEDLLHVSIDMGGNRDKPYIAVFRIEDGHTFCVNEIDKNCEKLYKILLGIEKLK